MASKHRDRILSRAQKLLAARKLDDAIRTLEPEVVRYHDSFAYYHLLALACLHSGDYGGAHTYYRRAREIKMRSCDVLLGMAVLYLRRGDTNRAISSWLEVLELHPGNKLASRALRTVRRLIERDQLQDWIDEGECRELFPPLPARFTISHIGIVALISSMGLAGLALILMLLPPAGDKRPGRQGLEESVLDFSDRRLLVDNAGSFSRVLTTREIEKSFERARSLFREYRDERAKVELNRILDSNASEGVKNKAEILKGYTTRPGFDTIKDRIPYEEVQADPLLYRDCWVIWRGMPANIQEGMQTTRFELLVDYDSKSTLRGIVPVEFDFASRIEAERPIEVLGQIRFETPEGGRLILKGGALHQSRSLGAPR